MEAVDFWVAFRVVFPNQIILHYIVEVIYSYANLKKSCQ